MEKNPKYLQALNKEEFFMLILNSKIFRIPTNFRFCNDINPNIYNILKMKHKYTVKSKINYEIFQSFINYLVNGEIPNISIENFSEYTKISEEFDFMKDLIQMFVNFMPKYSDSYDKIKNRELKQMKKVKIKFFNKKTLKYHQIIEHLFKNDGVYTYSALCCIKKQIFNACINQKVKLIDFLTRKKVSYKGLLFIIDEEELTASVYHNRTSGENIFIPKEIECDSKKFLVTCIVDEAFKNSMQIKSIQFSDDSELQKIGKRAFSSSSLVKIIIPQNITHIGESAFSNCHQLKIVEIHKKSKLEKINKPLFSWSNIESLSIPSSIEEFDDEWCLGTLYLNDIKISKCENESISYFNDSFIVGKSDVQSDDFDVLYFARRNIEYVNIPPFIKRIAPYAFDKCSKIKSVTFSEDSMLQSIDKYAFRNSSISSIVFPTHLSQIGEFAFFSCGKLKIVKFKKNSELVSIGRFAFSSSSIEQFSIPIHVTQIGEAAFSECKKLQKFTFPENSELKIISKSMFSMSAIKNIFLPLHITKIHDLAFSYCYQLKKIEFTEYSEVVSIGSQAFSNSYLESLNIPSKVVEIKDGWFSMGNLKEITVSSQNKKFSNYKGQFIIEKSDIKSDIFDILAVAPRNIKNVKIPRFIRRIDNYAFHLCNQLQKVEFSKNSELSSIGEYSFSLSSIKTVCLPSNVTCINGFAFFECSRLNNIEFCENSKLISINQFAFSGSTLKCFFIPLHVVNIADYAFSDCRCLQIIEISENSKLESIQINIFSGSSLNLIMIPAKFGLIFLEFYSINI